MKRTTNLSPHRAALLAWLCFYALTAHAADPFWTGTAGTGSGPWGVNGDWSGGPAPNSFADFAVFNDLAFPFTIDQSVPLTSRSRRARVLFGTWHF
jgi:hypothetical protein